MIAKTSAIPNEPAKNVFGQLPVDGLGSSQHNDGPYLRQFSPV